MGRMTDDENTVLNHAIYEIIQNGTPEEFDSLLRETPAALDEPFCGISLLAYVAKESGRVDFTEVVLNHGVDINQDERDGFTSALTSAIHSGEPDLAQFLLERGSDPNCGRAAISAINAKENSLELIKLLVEHGVDIHKCFEWPDGDVQNALSWAVAWNKHDVADYLRSLGAVMPDADPSAAKPEDLDDEIVAHFAKQIGKPQPLALTEIVPDGPPIAVHVISSADQKRGGLFKKQPRCVTLFTTGMSRQTMTVPEDGQDFRYAELFIQLPADWPDDQQAFRSPEHAWPFHWLRQIAKYPHEAGTWLGGPVAVIANEEPPEPLAPGLEFTCMLAVAEKDMTSKDGRFIQLYRLMPLYTEERNLEREQGAAALMQAFDKAGISFIFNPNRPNVAI